MVGLGKANLNLQLVVGPNRENFLFSLYDNEKGNQSQGSGGKQREMNFNF